MAIYDTGDLVRLSVLFQNITPVDADPTAVTFKVKNPSGTESTPANTKDSTGNYHVDQTIDETGRWYWRVEGTGAVVAAAEQSFVVRASEF